MQRNKFSIGDEVEIISPLQTSEKIKVEKIFDEQNKSIESVPHAMMKFRIPNVSKNRFIKGSIIRKAL